MSVITTRSITQLREAATDLGIEVPPEWGKAELFDALRDKTGGFDPAMQLDPMKAKDSKTRLTGREPFRHLEKLFSDEYVAEPKLDGVRMRMFMGLTANSLNSGRRSVRTYAYTERSDNFPHFRDAVVPALVGTVLDGELLAPRGDLQTHTGTWTDSLLNASVALVNSKPAGSTATQARFGKASFHVFDVLVLRGESVMNLPYRVRRKMLLKVLAEIEETHGSKPNIFAISSLRACEDTIRNCLASGYEGVVLKRCDSTYQPGKRGADWTKVKPFGSADAFIVGYTPGKNGNEGLVGSLEVAVATPEGPRSVAQVGNLRDDFRREITAEDGSLKPAWLGRVVEIAGQGMTKTSRVRHAQLVRLRPDKDADDCAEDQLAVFPSL